MRRLRSCAVFVLATILVSSLATASPTSTTSGTDTGDYAPDQVIIQFADHVSDNMRSALLDSLGLHAKGSIWGTTAQLYTGSHLNVPAVVEALNHNPNVTYAEPNGYLHAEFTPNDPLWSNQWGPQKVSAPAAWDLTQGSAAVTIAIVDTGGDLDHPDLAAKWDTVNGWDFVNDDSIPQDDHGHGTHTAGIAGASTQNSIGIAGMCPNCTLLPIKVLNSSGTGTWEQVASGINWAADHGASVINLSLGGSSKSITLENAVNYAYSKGLILACSAGNNNSNAFSYPAAYTNCLAVAATDSKDGKASFSNYGSWVDVSAPGVNIYSTVWNDSYTNMSGTSMAAPHVAGLAGLLFSQGKSQATVRAQLTSTNCTDPVTSNKIPRRINAYKAVLGC